MATTYRLAPSNRDAALTESDADLDAAITEVLASMKNGELDVFN